MKRPTHTLYDEPPLVISPTIAKILGLDEAIFIQQLHYWLQQRGGKVVEGVHWIYNTRDQWLEQFPFWSESTLKRIISSLRERDLIHTANLNETAMDKTLWYTINYDRLEDVLNGTMEKKESTDDFVSRSGQNEPIEGVKMTRRSGQNEPSNTRDYNQRVPREVLPPKSPATSRDLPRPYPSNNPMSREEVEQQLAPVTASPPHVNSIAAFVQAYPQHRVSLHDKPAILAAWKRAIAKESTPAILALLTKLEQQKLSYDWTKDGGRYVPSIVKYLDGEMWNAPILPAPGTNPADDPHRGMTRLSEHVYIFGPPPGTE